MPDAQILYLQDKQATLAQIEQALAAHLAKAQKGDLLFLYYCGHGYKLDSGSTCFACYDAGDKGIDGWDAATIPAAIEQHFPGQRAFLAADLRAASVTTYTIGEVIEVKWQGDWYPAVIQGVQGNLHLIHYVDYDATWGEWVGPRRMRRAK